MFEDYHIEQIRLLPMGQKPESGFPTEEAAREFLAGEFSEDGVYVYEKKGLNIRDQDALILFQYDGGIIGYGVFQSRNYEEGYQQFYPESVHNTERISSVELKAVCPEFNCFGQGMTKLDIESLAPLSVLLKVKQAVYDAG